MAARRMEQMETSDYVNERPQAGQNVARTERRFCYRFLFGFGLLCIIQALLNITLRLTLYSSKESTLSNYNASQCSDQITELEDTVKNLENELNALKQKPMDQSLSSRECPANWRRINDRCYFLSSESKTWEDSRQYCVGENSYLMVINSEEEEKALKCLVEDSKFWIGLSYKDGIFKWVDGSVPIERFRKPTGPVNKDVCMGIGCGEGLGWYWIHSFCESRIPWLCEKDP